MIIEDDVTRHDIPHEPGEWVETRLLAWKALDRAEAVVVDSMLEKVGKTPGLMQAFETSGQEAKELSPRDRLDHDTLLIRAVTGWSYTSKHNGQPIPVTEDNIGRLDPKTKDWLIDVIISENVMEESEGEVSAPTLG